MSPDIKQASQVDFLISYNRADRHWAEWIAWQLEEEGRYTAILQAWYFRPGDNYIQKLHEASVKAKRTIAVLSPEYLDELSTEPAWTAAFLQNLQGKEGSLLPVRVRECDVKGLLAPIIEINLTQQGNEVEARKILLQGLQAGSIRPKTAPFFPGGNVTEDKLIRASEIRGHVLQSLPERPFYPQSGQPITKTIEIFYSYAHEDEELRDKLEKHLAVLKAQGVITSWHDRQISPGKDWEREVSSHLDTSQIILLLVSADFIASNYCYGVEMKQAMKRLDTKEVRVIPIILRPVDNWQETPFGRLQALPRDGKAVTSWSNRDEAFEDVAKGIRQVINELVLPL